MTVSMVTNIAKSTVVMVSSDPDFSGLTEPERYSCTVLCYVIVLCNFSAYELHR